jgi:glycosyltransferase involved in cell wall biosynthesis
MDRLWLASNMQDEITNLPAIWDIFKDIVDGWLVVDSGSTDGTQQWLRDNVGDRLKLVESNMIQVNGYGFSRTKLVELSDADWVLIFDGDERMLPDDVEKIHPLINKYNKYDMIWLPRCHYQDWEMTKVEYGNMNTIGSDWKEALAINPDYQPRLIHRQMINGKNKVQFFRRVHERIEGVQNDFSSRTNPVIRHFGWLKTDERKKMVADLCETLWKMDVEKQEYVDTYELENAAGSALASNPWNKTEE